MLENLKLNKDYDGFLFLAEAMRNPPVLRPHHHLELELNLVVAGEVTYVVAGKRYSFPQRSLLWFFPSQEHQLVDRSSDAAYYVAVFKPEMLKRACRGPIYAPLRKKKPTTQGVLHTELEPEAFDKLRAAMQQITQEGLDPDLLNREAGFGLSKGFRFRHNDPDWLNAGLHHLLLRAWRCQHGRETRNREVHLHPAVRRALELMETEPAPGTCAELANVCGVSSTYLSRTFHREVGVPLSHYRNSIRLGRFWELYHRSPDRTILELALQAGFGSYTQFYRVYRKAYGVGPRGTALPGENASSRSVRG